MARKTLHGFIMREAASTGQLKPEGSRHEVHENRLSSRLMTLIEKIDEHAGEGQCGSASYALDRLTQIRKVVGVARDAYRSAAKSDSPT